ncbi:probable acyl-CoA dehydrogenase 6 [Oscarella lobularis]|uniref:probable acyl-CoA dehydrogenase 6 n=1 Tax=Oscarella lobularis TaxID=121494 RepID=UPI0033144887
MLFSRHLLRRGPPRRLVSSSFAVDLKDEAVFTEEHESMRKSLRQIIDQHINPHVDEWESAHAFPAHDLFKRLGDAGFLGVTKPLAYGGLGLDYTYSVAVAEELGRIRCGAVPMAIGVQTDMATPALARFGSDELRRQFLAPAIAGTAVTCVGVTETGAGSDVASIRTTARVSGDELVINGGKMWTTNGAQADWMCLLAITSDGAPHRNKSLICLPMDARGITISRKISKLGMHASDSTESAFDDVRVPRSYVIGELGKGFQYQMVQFQEERMFAVASVIDALDKAIDDTIEYARQRKAFGRSVLDNQVVHFRLAELKTEVEALRSLLYRTVGLYVKGIDVTTLASMGKLKAGRLARELTDACLQYWGGMGYSAEVDISRIFRDMRVLSIGGGTDEVMLGIICKAMKTLPSN